MYRVLTVKYVPPRRGWVTSMAVTTYGTRGGHTGFDIGIPASKSLWISASGFQSMPPFYRDVQLLEAAMRLRSPLSWVVHFKRWIPAAPATIPTRVIVVNIVARVPAMAALMRRARVHLRRGLHPVRLTVSIFVARRAAHRSIVQRVAQHDVAPHPLRRLRDTRAKPCGGHARGRARLPEHKRGTGDTHWGQCSC